MNEIEEVRQIARRLRQELLMASEFSQASLTSLLTSQRQGEAVSALMMMRERAVAAAGTEDAKALVQATFQRISALLNAAPDVPPPTLDKLPVRP